MRNRLRNMGELFKLERKMTLFPGLARRELKRLLVLESDVGVACLVGVLRLFLINFKIGFIAVENFFVVFEISVHIVDRAFCESFHREEGLVCGALASRESLIEVGVVLAH